MNDARAIAIVIGRAGSKGLANKNARTVAGRPMICHTIEHALGASFVDRVIVSTDGEDIAAAAVAMNVKVVERPARLATDTATVDDAVRHAVDASDLPHRFIAILYANVPVRGVGPEAAAKLIDRAVHTLIETGADSVQSYSPVGKHHPYWMMSVDDNGRVQPYVENSIYRRQDLPALYIPDGGVIAVTRSSLFSRRAGPHGFLGRDRRGIISEGPVVDVDTEADLAVAEALLRGAPMGGEAQAETVERRTGQVEPLCR